MKACSNRTLANALAACVLVLVCMMTTFGLAAYAQDGSSSASASAASASAASASSSSASSSAAAAGGIAIRNASVAAYAGLDPALDLADGFYEVNVVLTGGTGKATVESPAELEVVNGNAKVRLIWSSPYYDYMIVDGTKYLPVNKSGNSEFVVPVVAFDKPVAVIGDTTAMSEAHEVDYELTVLRDSIVALDGGTDALTVDAEAGTGMPWPWIVFIVCVVLSVVCIAITVALLRRYRKQTVA